MFIFNCTYYMRMFLEIHPSVIKYCILQLIGTPDEADLGFVNENAKRYILQLLRHAQAISSKVSPCPSHSE